MTDPKQQETEIPPISHYLGTTGNRFRAPLDILTDQEKTDQLAYAIENAKKAYAFRMSEMGLSSQEILTRIARKDWITEISPENVLQGAANRKFWALEDMEAKQFEARKTAENRLQVRSEWTAEKFLKVIGLHYVTVSGSFKPLAFQDKYFKAVAYLLSEDPRFETELGFSFKKGMLVTGDGGIGKTETLKGLRNNPIRPIQLISILEICDVVKEHGACPLLIDRLTVIDDVATEPVPVKHYGTEINWFKEFIEKMYLARTGWNNLIITTNADGNAFQKLYTHRVRSRMREMFNVISMKGEDQRK